jgi:hypothetical protein
LHNVLVNVRHYSGDRVTPQPEQYGDSRVIESVDEK